MSEERERNVILACLDNLRALMTPFKVPQNKKREHDENFRPALKI